MRPLQERLASDYATVAIDWPGFGDEPRPPISWQPAAYAAFLHYVLTHVANHPLATVAAGHAASYALSVAAASPKSAGMLCLIAPTWRGWAWRRSMQVGGARRLERSGVTRLLISARRQRPERASLQHARQLPCGERMVSHMGKDVLGGAAFKRQVATILAVGLVSKTRPVNRNGYVYVLVRLPYAVLGHAPRQRSIEESLGVYDVVELRRTGSISMSQLWRSRSTPPGSGRERSSGRRLAGPPDSSAGGARPE